MTRPAPAAAEQRVVIADRFPAVVCDPDGRIHDRARVVLTRDEMFVWVENGGGVHELVRQRYQLDGSTVGRGDWSILAVGGPWLVQRGHGCGCGSPLKRFVPWTPWKVGRP